MEPSSPAKQFEKGAVRPQSNSPGGGSFDSGRDRTEYWSVARIYDLVMTHVLDSDDFFIHRIQQHCAERGLNFFLVEPLWVELFLERLRKGEVWPRVLLNMHSEHHLPEDIYHRLLLLAHERKTKVIDPPDIAGASFDKARLHPRLVEHGFKVPP